MKDIEYSAGRVNSGENKERLFVAYTYGNKDVVECVEGRKRDNIFIGHISIEKYPAGKALCSAWRGHGAEVFLICISTCPFPMPSPGAMNSSPFSKPARL